MPLTRGSGRTKSSIGPPLPRGFRIGTRTRAGSRPSTSRTLTEGPSRSSSFPRGRATRNGESSRWPGPGVALLEYLRPGGGRPMPADERANDLIHWQTILASPDAGELASALLAAKAPFVSPGVVAIDEPGYPFPAGFLVRDPDGHVLQVMQAVTIEKH